MMMIPEASSQGEPLFGDPKETAEIERLLETGLIVRLGPIERFIKMIAPHANLVELVKLYEQEGNHEEEEEEEEEFLTPLDDDDLTIETPTRATANFSDAVEVVAEDGMLLSIFKPHSGEDKMIIQREKEFATDIPAYYIREYESYLVSKHFGFGIVPPTAIREVDHEVGSLQYLVDPSKYRPLLEAKQSLDLTGPSMDRDMIAVFDWLILGWDRNENNMLINIEDPSQRVAIDHGSSFSINDYISVMAFKGPSHDLTAETNPHYIPNQTPHLSKERPIFNPIPEKILQLLRDGYENRAALTTSLQSVTRPKFRKDEDGYPVFDGYVRDLSDQDIAHFWQRVKYAIDFKVFISRDNFQALMRQQNIETNLYDDYRQVQIADYLTSPTAKSAEEPVETAA